MTPLVSAVVTTYRRPGSVRRAVRSVLDQTYDPVELIVVEDDVEPTLPEWITGGGDDSIRYRCHGENRGLPAARNTGLREASGTYVAYLDDDDWWKPPKIRRQVDLHRSLDESHRRRTAVVQCGIEVRRPAGAIFETVHPSTAGSLRQSIVENGISTASSSYLFTREHLEEVGGFSEDLASHVDHDLFLKLARENVRGECVEEPLVVTVDDPNRPSMMSDVAGRVEGTRQFLSRWDSDLREWMGSEDARTFQARYAEETLVNLLVRNALAYDLAAVSKTLGAMAELDLRPLPAVRKTSYQLVRQFLRYKSPTQLKDALEWLASRLGGSNSTAR